VKAEAMTVPVRIAFRYDHVGLSVSDLDAQQRFYRNAFGLVDEVGRSEFPQAQIRTVILRGRNGLQIELIERTDSQPRRFADAYEGAATQGFFHWALAVDRLEHAYASVLQAGAEPVSPPGDASRPGVRFAYVKDPEGNLIELISASPVVAA
jgi:catechol 2,3-dioxygenase-like lactoylglutathione lyase family enzyme